MTENPGEGRKSRCGRLLSAFARLLGGGRLGSRFGPLGRKRDRGGCGSDLVPLPHGE
jgi:hypothetical protein